MIKHKQMLSICILVLMVMPLQLGAVTESDILQTGRTELYMRDVADGRIVMAPQLDTQVRINISGLISRVVVRQRFTNNTDRWQEGIYVFPLPDTAAVDHMRLWIGERFIEGDIEEKRAAAQIYQEAKSSGRQAGLVHQVRSNIFTTSVANIAPHDEIVVEIEYQQDVHYEQGRFSLRFPMVVAPRYIPGKKLTAEINGFKGTGWAEDTDQVTDASFLTPHVIDAADPQINSVALWVDLNAGMPLAEINSPYHAVEVNEVAEGKYRIELQNGSVQATRDFELNWQAFPGKEPKAAWFWEQLSGASQGYYGLLMIMPPALEKETPDVPRELILLVDTSGSMHGASMEQAKSALALAINRLSTKDHFNIIQFNHSTRSLFDRAVPATEANLRQARDYISSLRADGGTEMMPALELALDAEFYSGMLRQVVFITDGAVGNEQALFQLIHLNLHESRLFTVGIGSAPNSHFMTRTAEAGRGSYTYIGQVEEVQEKMQQLFAKLESPALTEIELDWRQEVQQWPSKVPDLYAGEPVLVSVRSDRPLSELNLQGKLGDQVWSRNLVLNGGSAASGIHVLWARKQIRELLGNAAETDAAALRAAIVDIAKAHHLVSRYTSLVAVDKTPVRPVGEEMVSQPLPVHMPEGWSVEKVFGKLPKTATSAELQLVIGLLCLLLAGLMWISGDWKRGLRQVMYR